MRAVLFICLSILSAPHALRSAEPPHDSHPLDDRSEELQRRLKELKAKETELLRKRTGAAEDKAKDLDREIAELRRDMREAVKDAQAKAKEADRQVLEARREAERQAAMEAKEAAKEIGREAKEAAKEIAREAKEAAKEADRQARDAGREADRQARDASREAERLTAEAGRLTEEAGRRAEEAGRRAAEAGRLAAEAGRLATDAARDAARDAERQAREAGRQATEAGRRATEAGRRATEAAKEAGRHATEAAAQIREAFPAQDAALVSARRHRMQSNYSEAAKLYSGFIADYPKSPRLYEARFWFAKCRLSEQKLEEAAKAFTEFLKYHSDQRTYSQQAKEDRIFCWKALQGRSPDAVTGLRAALNDPSTDIRVQAALALADGKDASGRAVLEAGLRHPRLGEQCGLALWKLGVREKPEAGVPGAQWTRMLMVKVKTPDPDESFEMRVPIKFVKGLEKMLPEDAMEEMKKKGLDDIFDMAAGAPKGQVLFQFRSDNGKTSVVISVD